MTAPIIIYATTILALATALYIATRTIKRQRSQIRELNEDIDRYMKAELHPAATYSATFNETFGYTYVTRHVQVSGGKHTTLIKVFTDEDADYNLREAEDLVKHLNER